MRFYLLNVVIYLEKYSVKVVELDMENKMTYYHSANYGTINIETYLPLVDQIIKQLNLKESSLIDYDDLFSIGIMGLLDAIDKYNNHNKVSFNNYARLRIKSAILNEIRQVEFLSRDKIALIETYYKKCEEIQQLLLRNPSDEEICECMQIGIDELLKIHSNINCLSISSLDEAIDDCEGEPICLCDLLKDSADNALNLIEKKELKQELLDAIWKLSDREMIILHFYYKEELSLACMSEILNISMSRISQLHKQAIKNLRHHLLMEKNY